MKVTPLASKPSSASQETRRVNFTPKDVQPIETPEQAREKFQAKGQNPGATVSPAKPPLTSITAETREPGQIRQGEDPTKTTEATAGDMDPRFAALARKEQTFRQNQKQFAQEKLNWEQSRTRDYVAKAELAKDYVSKADLKGKTLEVLAEAGITYDDLTVSALTHTEAKPVDKTVLALQAQVDKLTSELTEFKGTTKQAQTAGYEQAVNQIRNDAKLLIESDPSFETIKATDQVEEVVNLIKRIHKDEGLVLSVEAACKLVEEEAVEREAKRFLTLKGLSKIQAKLQPSETTPAPETGIVPKQAPGQKPMTTLTNQQSSTRTLSARDRAVLAFRGELPKN